VGSARHHQPTTHPIGESRIVDRYRHLTHHDHRLGTAHRTAEPIDEVTPSPSRERRCGWRMSVASCGGDRSWTEEHIGPDRLPSSGAMVELREESNRARRLIMRRMLTALAVVALLGACGSDDSEASLSDTLTGSTWLTQDDYYQTYHDDGTYAVDSTMARAEGDVSAADLEWGTWTLDENVLSLTPDAESTYCTGLSATYLLEVTDGGNRIEVSIQDDDCSVRSAGFPPALTRAES
jgi:hypothetical protein